MLVPNSPPPVATLHRPLDPALAGSRQEDKFGPVAHPAPAQAETPVSAETQPGPDFKEIVRANLQADSQHATLGHEGPSFRECSRPSCRNASNLIPYPVVVEAPVRVEPEWPDDAGLHRLTPGAALCPPSPSWSHLTR